VFNSNCSPTVHRRPVVAVERGSRTWPTN